LHSDVCGDLRALPASENLGLDIFNNFDRFGTTNILGMAPYFKVDFLKTVMVKMILQKIHMQDFSLK